jgi:hypothetical protein
MSASRTIRITNKVNTFFLDHSFEAANDSGYLEDLVDEMLPDFEYVSSDHRMAMKYLMYKVFPLYKDAKKRSVTNDPYVNHAIGVARRAGEVTTDIAIIAAGLGHDGPEEFYSSFITRKLVEAHPEKTKRKKELEAEIKTYQRKRVRGRKRKLRQRRVELTQINSFLKKKKRVIEEQYKPQENEIMNRYVRQSKEMLLGELRELVDPVFAETLIENVFTTMERLTRMRDERYYDSVEKLYRPPSREAIILKFCDGLENTDDMEREERRPFSTDLGSAFSYGFLISMYDGNKHDLPRLRNLERSLGRNARTVASRWGKKKKKDFTSAEKLYRLYKNLIVVNQYRIYKRDAGEIEEVKKIELLKKTLSVADEIIEEICVRHVNYFTRERRRSRKHLTPEKIYAIHEENEAFKRDGGYDAVDDPIVRGDGRLAGFAGTLKFFFHTRVHGDSERLDDMYNNKETLFRAALALKTLTERYIVEEGFVLDGFDRLKEEHPSEVAYVRAP